MREVLKDVWGVLSNPVMAGTLVVSLGGVAVALAMGHGHPNGEIVAYTVIGLMEFGVPLLALVD